MPFPIHQKYLLGVFARFLLLTLFVFVSIFVMVNFVQIIVQGALGGFSLYFLLKSLLYLLPNIVAMSLPVSFLMAVLLSLSQLSQEGEIIAFRAGGFSFADILGVMFGASLLTLTALIFLNNWFGPIALKKSTDYTLAMVNSLSRIELKPRTFQKFSDWVIYSEEVDKPAGTLGGVKLIRRKNDGETPQFVTKISSKSGTYRVQKEKGLSLSLKNGEFTQTDYKAADKVLYGEFETYNTFISFLSNAGARKLNQRELSTPALMARLKDSALEAELKIKYRVEIASRLVLSLAPIVFFLIGAPLGVGLEKKSRATGFVLSLLILFFYYGFSITAIVMSGRHFGLFPWIMLGPAVSGLLLGAWLWRQRLSSR